MTGFTTVKIGVKGDVMENETSENKLLWLLRGDRTEPGWGPLEADARSGEMAVVIFDRGAGWALVRSTNPVEQYEGMVSEAPKDGLYVSEQGYPIYIVNRQEVRGPREVIAAIGDKAEKMLEEMDDPDAVLQRLGYAY